MKNKILALTSLLTLLIGVPMVMASATSYYSKTTMYFSVPSDATFSIAMPSDYTSWTEITATSESGTATDWISFNFTGIPNPTLVEPYQLGASANAQAGMTKPIIYIDNTGNVNEKFEIKASASLPTGVEVYFNATGGATPTTTLTALTTNYQTIEAGMDNTKYLNVTLYANASSSASAGQSNQDLIIKSSAV